jgi:signal transduction histidine kinase
MPRNVEIGAESPPAFATCPQRAVCDQSRRRVLVRQLQQVQQRASLSAIAAGLAHDFKNLMTTISLHSDLIGMSLPPDAAQQQNIAFVRQAVKQSNDLLGRLVEVIWPQKRCRPALMRIEEELKAVDCLIRGVAGPHVRVVLQLNATALVRIDRTALQQIVLNCVSNATQAMKGKGSLQIRVRSIHLGRAAAADFEPPMTAGDYTELSIRDTGSGMNPRVMRNTGKVHGPSSGDPGWGIGLTVMQACAVRANGAVRIQSREGRGTCVTVVLPVAREPRTGRKSKVLVVRSS